MKFSTATLLALMIAGCSNDAPEADPGRPSTSSTPDSTTAQPAPSIQPVVRPESMLDTLKLVGDTLVTRMKLVSEGIPFTTYYPEDEMTMTQSSSGEGTGLRFIGKFGGLANEEISIHFFFPPIPTTVETMDEYVTGAQGAALTADWGLRGPAQTSCPWAAISYNYVDNQVPGIRGVICIGRHNANAFYMVTHYPDADAAGLQSRLEQILSHIRWKDDGTQLRKE